jgi:hypothetical protein
MGPKLWLTLVKFYLTLLCETMLIIDNNLSASGPTQSSNAKYRRIEQRILDTNAGKQLS